jgi:hypothetical protein
MVMIRPIAEVDDDKDH